LDFANTSGAIFNSMFEERYVLWRKWDNKKPKVLFIGLNPSKADANHDDPTTKRIIAHSKRLGFGGCFLMNCFTQIATNPKELGPSGNWQNNLRWLNVVATYCSEVVFAWGKHELVNKLGRDIYFENRFPDANCLGKNMDGSPKHPLYLPYSSKLLQFRRVKA